MGKFLTTIARGHRATWIAVALAALLGAPFLAGAVWLGLGSQSPKGFPTAHSGAAFDYGRGELGPLAPLSGGFIAKALGSLIELPGSREPARPRAGGDETNSRVGSGALRVVDVHPLVNDDFADARAIGSIPFTARTRNVEATREPDEPSACGSVGGTVWYSYRPARDVQLSAYTFGSDHAAALGAFSMIGEGLHNEDCDTDSAGNAFVSFPAKGGTRYYFQVAAPAGGGALVFNLEPHGTFTHASLNERGEPPDGEVLMGGISGDGRYVAFMTWATNFGAGEKGPCVKDVLNAPLWRTCPQVYLRDTRSGTTELISASPSGAPGDRASQYPTPSADGRFVVFESNAENLVPTSPLGASLYLRDRQTGSTERIPSGCGYTEDSNLGRECLASLSDDGRYIAFQSLDSSLVPGDTNQDMDVFVYDRWTRRHERVSVDHLGKQAPHPTSLFFERGTYLSPYISGSGRFVVFRHPYALVPEDTNGLWDTYVRDRLTGSIERVSVSSAGGQGNGDTQPVGLPSNPLISSDGRFVAFASGASNLTEDDNDDLIDIFVRDRFAKKTLLVSGAFVSAGQTNQRPWWPSISGDGRYVVYESSLEGLLTEVGYESHDVYRYDILTGTTRIITVSSSGEDTWGWYSQISRDGRSVMFRSRATNLGDTSCFPGDTFPTRCGNAFVYRSPDYR